EGAGAPLSGSLSVRPDELALSAHSAGLDLSVLAQAGGLPEGSIRGSAEIDAENDFRKGHRRGPGRVGAERAAVFALEGIEAHGEANLDDSELTAGAIFGAGKLGSVLVTTQPVVLKGSALSARAWRDATGIVLVDANTDLDAVNSIVPGYILPFDQ